MNDPLVPGGVNDYPIKVGSMLLTLVDPHRGYEVAYNRWYERDHYYAGCMIGPFLFAGSRWVATRALKDLRWPTDDETVAAPPDAGTYVAIYFVEAGHHEEHFSDWARPQVNRLYAAGRGFAERRHIHTVLFDPLAAVYRDADPVPMELALDHGYDAIVLVWLDGRDGVDAVHLHERLAVELLPTLLKDSPIEIATAWTPSAGRERAPQRADGPGLEGRRPRTPPPDVLRPRRRAQRVARTPRVHRPSGARRPRNRPPRRAVPQNSRRHRHVHRPTLVAAVCF